MYILAGGGKMIFKADHNKKNKGQALVEMALILPALVLLIFGMVDFSRVLNANLTATEAAREIARVAALKGTAADANAIISEVETKVTATLKNTDLNPEVVIVPLNSSSRASGTDVSVEVKASVNLITPGVNTMLTNPFPVSAIVIMRVE